MIRRQRGQVMAFIAVALGIVVMPVAAYAVDSATVSAAAAALEEATATAAVEASQQLDISAFRATGVLSVDAAAARTVAQAVIAADVPMASITSVTASGAEIRIATREDVSLPFDFFPGRTVRLQASASARLAGGYDRPSSRLPMASASDSSGSR
jgi:hypothetical protein